MAHTLYPSCVPGGTLMGAVLGACRRRPPARRRLHVALIRWRRFILRKVIGNRWHWWGELIKLAKAKAIRTG